SPEPSATVRSPQSTLGGTPVLKHIKSQQDWEEKNLGAKGFTLIELLVVIVILGILAAVVIFAVSGITDKGQVSACKTEASTVKTAEESYNAQYGAYAAGFANISPGFLQQAPQLVTITYSTTAPTYAWAGDCATYLAAHAG